METSTAPSTPVLLCRSGLRTYALPLAPVREIMRALPLNPVPEMPDFMLGLAMIRGVPVPVVALARLAGALSEPGAATPPPARYITLALGGRSVALAVDDVMGVRNVAVDTLAQVAPLLEGGSDGFVQAIAALDHELLLVLRGGRLMPQALWEALAGGSRA